MLSSARVDLVPARASSFGAAFELHSARTASCGVADVFDVVVRRACAFGVGAHAFSVQGARTATSIEIHDVLGALLRLDPHASI